MRGFKVPNWLLLFGVFYVLVQLATIEFPPKDVDATRMPSVFGKETGIITHTDYVNALPHLNAGDLSNLNNKTFDDSTKQESVVCMAKNAYFEARSQSVLSQIAVSQVVMNRVQSPDFPNTVCGVIYEAQFSRWYKEKMDKEVPLKNRCQFSWYCDGKADIITDIDAYKIALAVAHQVLNRYTMHDVTDGALFYHAYYVNPRWASQKVKTVVHEDHIFYREPKELVLKKKEK